MYVSKDTIFIHNPRAAGSSVKIALCKDGEALKYRIKPPSVHGFATDIRERVGHEAWDKAWTFAILRNPYARLVGLWYFSLHQSEAKGLKRIRKGMHIPGHKKIPEATYKNVEKSIKRSRQRFIDTKRNKIRFNEFKWWVLKFCENYQWNPWFDDGRPITRIPQTDWICNSEGKVIVDNLFTLEHIEELTPYLQRGGFGKLPHTHGEKPGAQPWGAYYDDEMIEFVKKHFASDLALGLWNDIDMNIILHQEGYFQGLSTLSKVREIDRLIKQTGSKSLLDFGCGKGYQYSVHRVHKRWGVMPKLYDPGVLEYSILTPEIFDGIICIDVMEHITESQISDTLDRIFSQATKFVYLFIATIPSHKSLPDGRNCHITVKPKLWWDNEIAIASDKAHKSYGWDGIVEVGYNDGVG